MIKTILKPVSDNLTKKYAAKAELFTFEYVAKTTEIDSITQQPQSTNKITFAI